MCVHVCDKSQHIVIIFKGEWLLWKCNSPPPPPKFSFWLKLFSRWGFGPYLADHSLPCWHLGRGGGAGKRLNCWIFSFIINMIAGWNSQTGDYPLPSPCITSAGAGAFHCVRAARSRKTRTDLWKSPWAVHFSLQFHVIHRLPRGPSCSLRCNRVCSFSIHSWYNGSPGRQTANLYVEMVNGGWGSEGNRCCFEELADPQTLGSGEIQFSFGVLLIF